MPLENPRVYSWTPDRDWPSQPFVTGEGLGSRRSSGLRHLAAGDGHRLPFPRRILSSDRYWNSQNVRACIYVVTGNQPYHGVNYVMEISLSGDRRLTAQIGRAISQISPGSPRLPHLSLIGGGVAQGVVAPARPSPLAAESHWTQTVQLAEGSAVIRYDFFPN